ncbi:DUF5685 family protein [Nonomuraea terrae]|uniref:DUF5685 family protein n=1 Tax=Nonomuraea terrae TaxID=2530383 RepID=UPI0037A35162
MFGIIRPCGEHGCPSLREAWRAHLCGLCLTLRDGHGQGARLATNYDTLIISVLTEAQLPSAAPRRTAGPCALRGFRGAEVVDARASGARLAAGVSLVLAAGKIRDHVADGDAGRATAGARTRLAARWEKAGARLAAEVGFDTTPLAATVTRQLALERAFAARGHETAVLERAAPPVAAVPEPTEEAVAGAAEAALAGARQPAREAVAGVLELTAPAEEAVAAAFAHTAVLAGRPENAAALAEAGRFFGRIAHLVDAYEDRAEDDARGAFNPLTATGTTPEEARRLCDDAAHGLALALAEVRFEERHLVDALLGAEVRRAVDRAFRPAADLRRRPGWIRRSAAGTAIFLTCGLWRPEWSTLAGESWDERCYVCRYGDCCSNCGDCCSCCSSDGCCCDGCSCSCCD